MSLHKHFCCPHCGGVIFYTNSVDPTKDTLENSKVSYKEKEEHTQLMRGKNNASYGKIPHEQVTNIVSGAWKILFVTKRKKYEPNPLWIWWRQ